MTPFYHCNHHKNLFRILSIFEAGVSVLQLRTCHMHCPNIITGDKISSL